MMNERTDEEEESEDDTPAAAAADPESSYESYEGHGMTQDAW